MKLFIVRIDAGEESPWLLNSNIYSIKLCCHSLMMGAFIFFMPKAFSRHNESLILCLTIIRNIQKIPRDSGEKLLWLGQSTP